ncbi:MAG: universal stress protein [Puia sp.]|nr:universal stress protein [Puia sp.]
MEKILVAIDSQCMDEATVAFACQLAKLTQSKLTGVFLEEPEMEDAIFLSRGKDSYVDSVEIREAGEEDPDRVSVRRGNMDLFRELAEENNVQVCIHLDKGVPIEELVAESRFSDVLIVNAATSFSDMDENVPTGFVKNVLHDAGCPVIISPEQFDGVDNIVFCYDGSKSAVFAMKQFTYLFPELKSRRVKVIYLNDETAFTEEEVQRVAEWIRHHYNNDVEWVISNEEAKEALFDFLVKKGSDFVVMGAYGKGLLASFFRPGGNGKNKGGWGDEWDEEEGEGLRTAALPIFVSHF